MKRIVAAVASLALASCIQATKPAAPESVIPVPTERLYLFQGATDETSQVVATRDIGLLAKGCPMAFLVNGQKAADIRTGERAVFNLAAGEHVIGVEPSGGGLCAMGDERRHRNEISVTIKAGESKRFRLSVDVNGKPGIAPTTL